MKCGYCGKTLKKNAKFCTNCGKSVTDFPEESSQASKDSGLGAVVALIATVIIILAGSVFMILRGINKISSGVSSSDASNPSSVASTEEPVSEEVFSGDPALSGNWWCEDKSAVNYTDSDYGIEIRLGMTLNNGDFIMDYTVFNTGIIARKVNLIGRYSTENNILVLKPESPSEWSGYGGSYFNAENPQISVKYSIDGDTLTLTDESGKEIIFKRK